MTIKSPKKLIEVALPLDDINVASAREKSIRHGHPSTLHLWWARRPLAAARAVIFAQMVNDPGYQQDCGFKYGVNKKEAEIKREKLFAIIRDLVKWENTNNEEVLERAREVIRESWRETCQLNRDHPQAAELFNPDKHPAFHDPFAGGGALPLEERSELRGMRSECDALSGGDCLAEGDVGGKGGLSSGAEVAEGGDLRHALADHACGRLDSSEHCRGLDSRVGSGKDAVSSDCSRVARRDRDLADTLRADRLVSGARNAEPQWATGRDQPNTHNPASQTPLQTLTPHSSQLFPSPPAHAYNELIASWSAIVAASYETGSRGEQIGLVL